MEGANTNSIGAYTIAGVPNVAGLNLVATACPSCSQPVMAYVNGYYSSSGTVRSIDNATVLDFSSGNVLVNIDLTLEVGNTITGYISHNTSTKIADVDVFAQDADSHDNLGSARTEADGHYVISNLPNGSYHLQACPSCQGLPYLDEYYNNIYDADAATVFVLEGGETRSIYFDLANSNTIRGVVTDSGGNGIDGISVFAHVWGTDTYVNGGQTGKDGTYSINSLPDGNYRIMACPQCDNQPYYDQFYNGASQSDQATSVGVSGGQTITAINFSLSEALLVTGQVTDQSTSLPIENIVVTAESTRAPYDGYSAVTNSDGEYAIYVQPGYFRITAFADQDNAGHPTSTY